VNRRRQLTSDQRTRLTTSVEPSGRSFLIFYEKWLVNLRRRFAYISGQLPTPVHTGGIVGVLDGHATSRVLHLGSSSPRSDHGSLRSGAIIGLIQILVMTPDAIGCQTVKNAVCWLGALSWLHCKWSDVTISVRRTLGSLRQPPLKRVRSVSTCRNR
jgi:hypothetical protein